MTATPIHAFLAGRGRDGRGRVLADVLAFDDAAIEGVHDFVQWCFPLAEASRAVPGSPVLTPAEAQAIRSDETARSGLLAALARMARFYAESDGWLCALDHNHLRITRILTSVRDLAGDEEALGFHALILRRNAEKGSPVNAGSLAFWSRAIGE